jgi:hypothetical protein
LIAVRNGQRTGAVQLLHAANTPPIYNVAEINVRDKGAYEKALAEALELIKAGGAKYFAGGFDKTHTSLDLRWRQRPAGPG